MSHITLEQRYRIQAMRESGRKNVQIALDIGKSGSVVCRELKRNCDGRNGAYSAAMAQRKYEKRQAAKPRAKKFTPEVQATVEALLREDLSPEQVSGHCRKNGIGCVSPERIYQHVWQDKKQKGSLHTHLRRRGRKNKKRGAKLAGRGMIPDRVGIEKRPPIVEEKARFGDLEIDTVIGKNHKGALLTINDRASGMLKMKKVENRTAELVTAAATELLEEWGPFINTITADNGKEFAMHKELAEELGVDFYFANPYHSWERGANENLNGLIRQYFPKKTDFSTITEQQVQDVQEKLNQRPRKRFKFENPLKIMNSLLFNPKIAFVT